MNKSLSLLTALTIIIAKPAISQNTIEADLEEVKIYSGKVEQTHRESGRNISIITREDINELPVHSLDELLRYLPGLEVQSRGGFGVQSDISLRGSTFSQVLVLIDGMRINDPLTAHFNSNMPVSVSEIKRIEILRGPATATYGPDAVGGVINIITRTFQPTNEPKKLHTDGSLLVGENNLFSSEAGIYIKQKKYAVALGAMLNQSDGHRLPSDLRGDFDLKTLSLSGNYKLSDKWRAAIRTAWDSRDFNAQYFYTRSPFDLSREVTTTSWNQLHLKRISNYSHTSFDVGYKSTSDTFLFNPAFPANVHKTRFLNTQINHSWHISQKMRISFGAQYDLRTIESTDRGDHTNFHTGIYGILFVKPLEKLSVTASLRGDYDEVYEFEILPQLNVAWAEEKLTLRTSVGRSIRAADFTERYISTNIPGELSAYRNLGNPFLGPETAWSYEAGADFSLSKGLELRLTGFIRQSDNLIDYILTSENEIINNNNLQSDSLYFYTQNIKELTTRGVEAEIWYTRKLGQKAHFQFIGGYSWFDSYNDEGVVSKYISNHANHLVTANAIFAHKLGRISINTLYKHRNGEMDETAGFLLEKSYAIVNAQVDINAYKNAVFLTLQAKNIFNEKYSDILGAEMPGRWMMAGVRWNFNRRQPPEN